MTRPPNLECSWSVQFWRLYRVYRRLRMGRIEAFRWAYAAVYAIRTSKP